MGASAGQLAGQHPDFHRLKNVVNVIGPACQSHRPAGGSGQRFKGGIGFLTGQTDQPAADQLPIFAIGYEQAHRVRPRRHIQGVIESKSSRCGPGVAGLNSQLAVEGALPDGGFINQKFHGQVIIGQGDGCAVAYKIPFSYLNESKLPVSSTLSGCSLSGETTGCWFAGVVEGAGCDALGGACVFVPGLP